MTTAVNNENLQNSVLGLYEATLGALPWDLAMQQVADCLEANAAFFELYNLDRVPSAFRYHSVLVPDVIEAYDDYISEHPNPRLDWLINHVVYVSWLDLYSIFSDFDGQWVWIYVI